MDAASLFALELVRRGIVFRRDDASRFTIQTAGLGSRSTPPT